CNRSGPAPGSPVARGPPHEAADVLRFAYQLMAYCRSWALVARLSVRFRLWRWVSTVLTESPSPSAASPEGWPRPGRVSTCGSRLLSRVIGWLLATPGPADPTVRVRLRF